MTALWVRGFYFFLIALTLALLEIQIEGKHGWAEKLPTWRWQSPLVLRIVGKPITGYHVCLVTFLLLFFHLPFLYVEWSIAREMELLSFFFLLTVFWDFLWFLCNPHFGWKRFRAGQVWWFPKWWGPFPVGYYAGLSLSFTAYLLSGPWKAQATRWGILLAQFIVLTLATFAVIRLVQRPPRTS